MPSEDMMYVLENKGKLEQYAIIIAVNPEIEICRHFEHLNQNGTVEWGTNFAIRFPQLINQKPFYVYTYVAKVGIKYRFLVEDLKTIQKNQDFNPPFDIKNVKDIYGNSFRWDKIPGNESLKLRDLLEHNFGISWIKTARFEKINNGMAIRAFNDDNSLSLTLNEKETRLTLTIDDVRKSEFTVKKENGEIIVCYIDKTEIDQIDMPSWLKIKQIEKIKLPPQVTDFMKPNNEPVKINYVRGNYIQVIDKPFETSILTENDCPDALMNKEPLPPIQDDILKNLPAKELVLEAIFKQAIKELGLKEGRYIDDVILKMKQIANDKREQLPEDWEETVREKIENEWASNKLE